MNQVNSHNGCAVCHPDSANCTINIAVSIDVIAARNEQLAATICTPPAVSCRLDLLINEKLIKQTISK